MGGSLGPEGMLELLAFGAFFLLPCAASRGAAARLSSPWLVAMIRSRGSQTCDRAGGALHGSPTGAEGDAGGCTGDRGGRQRPRHLAQVGRAPHTTTGARWPPPLPIAGASYGSCAAYCTSGGTRNWSVCTTEGVTLLACKSTVLVLQSVYSGVVFGRLGIELSL